jgi:hypothetical protein
MEFLIPWVLFGEQEEEPFTPHHDHRMEKTDGNLVSLRVTGHLRPSTLWGSLVGRISAAFSCFCHFDKGIILLPGS